MNTVHVQDRWWQAVKKMADLVTAGYCETELTEGYVREELVEAGFGSGEIDLACEWVEKALNSGTLSESLAMLQDQSHCARIRNPLEGVCFSEEVWNKIESCYQKGLLSRDKMERLLEGARVIDTRDWEDDDVTGLLAEMLNSINPSISESEYLNILERGTPSYYC